QYQLVGSVQDYAGNAWSMGSIFTTGQGPGDTTPPVVVSVSPANGATGVPINMPVVLTFSEPLNPETINEGNFALFANGSRMQNAFVTASPDNTKVTLALSFGSLPAGSVVTVVATRDVKDLSGNRLADFTSQFATAAVADTTRPQVIAVRPQNGAAGIAPTSSVVLIFSESINPSTASNAIFVAAAGRLVSGTLVPSSQNLVMTFIPTLPFGTNALV